jgi:HD-like signal output (HDOD) protein
MRVSCKECGREFDLPVEKLPKERRFVLPCPVCQGSMPVDTRTQKGKPKQRVGGVRLKPIAAARQTSSDDLRGDGLRERVLASIDDLPPMPEVIFRAREVMTNQRSSFDDLAAVLETDPAIVSKVLRLANSAYYGLSGQISSVQQATVYLGHKTLAEVITVAGTSSLLGVSLDGYGMAAGQLWAHSLAVAYGSRMIAEKRCPELADSAFSAGLMHDIGKLILAPFIEPRREEFITLRENSKLPHQAERTLLGVTHAEIASDVCRHWCIPRDLARAIRNHHEPPLIGKDRMSAVVYVANGIAHMTGLGREEEERFVFNSEVLRLLGYPFDPAKRDDLIYNTVVDVINAVNSVLEGENEEDD